MIYYSVITDFINNFFYFWRLACDCPKGDPLWVPPILAQQCKEDGECYCPSYNGKTHSKTERGCVESSKQEILSNLHYSFPDVSPSSSYLKDSLC